MKLSRDELKGLSAGATAVEYGSLLKALIAKIVAFIVKLFGGGTTPEPDPGGGGGGGGGDDGGHGGGGGGGGGR